MLSLTFVDIDYNRGSRAHGRRVPPSPPEGCALGRSGIVRAEWDGVQLRVTGTKLINGPRPASSLIRTLEGSGLIVGHGILTPDLRAARMVTVIPDSLLTRVVDTLVLAWQVRGKRYPTGCGLSAMIAANTGSERAKPSYSASAPGVRSGWADEVPRRGSHDPRDDAILVAELWETLVTRRLLSWGAGRAWWTPGERTSGEGSPGGTAALTGSHIDILTGRRPQVDTGGQVPWWWHYATMRGYAAVSLASLSAADLPTPALIRDIAETVVPSGAVLTDEDLWTACQYLGTKQNLDVRERIAAGRGLTRMLREPLERAIRNAVADSRQMSQTGSTVLAWTPTWSWTRPRHLAAGPRLAVPRGRDPAPRRAARRGQLPGVAG